MKRYRVQVNGRAYEVDVEEVGTVKLNLVSSQTSKTEQIPAAAQGRSASAATPPSEMAKNASALNAHAAPSTIGDEIVECPMPGKIVSIEVKPGQAVKEGDVIVVLEAMKMENEICCGIAGNVKEICVIVNASVNTGDKLAVIG